MDQAHEQPIHESFYNLYRGLHRAYGKFVRSEGYDNEGKIAGKAATIKDLYVSELWKLHLTGKQGLGVIPIMEDGNCFWGAIDIDIYPLDILALETKIRGLNYPFVVLRSKSGGAHLTMFFSEPISCKVVRKKLHAFAIKLGFPNSEVFPKQFSLVDDDDCGNWLNMPYFDMKKTTRPAIYKGEALHPEAFLRHASDMRMTKAQFEAIKIEICEEFSDGPPCLQAMVKQGGVQEGGRNEALFAMMIYCKKKHGRAGTAEDELYKLNDAHMKPPLTSKEVRVIIKSAGRQSYGYPCDKYPLVQFCNRDVCKDRRFGIGVTVKDLGFCIEKLEKLDTDPVEWKVTITDGRRLSVKTADIVNQQAFRIQVAAQMNFLPIMIKQKDWEKFVNEAMARAENIEAPGETRVYDRVELLIEEYVRTSAQVIELDELVPGRIYRDEREVAFFYGENFMEYVSRQGMTISIGDLWGHLYTKGATTQVFTIQGVRRKMWGFKAKAQGNKVNTDEPSEAF